MIQPLNGQIPGLPLNRWAFSLPPSLQQPASTACVQPPRSLLPCCLVWSASPASSAPSAPSPLAWVALGLREALGTAGKQEAKRGLTLGTPGGQHYREGKGLSSNPSCLSGSQRWQRARPGLPAGAHPRPAPQDMPRLWLSCCSRGLALLLESPQPLGWHGPLSPSSVGQPVARGPLRPPGNLRDAPGAHSPIGRRGSTSREINRGRKRRTVPIPPPPPLPSPTSIRIGLRAVAILQSVAPGPFVFGPVARALPHTVASLKSVRPLALVHPLPLALQADAVALALRPGALVRVAAGPGVDAQHLKAVAPRAGVFALALWAGADAMAVRLAVLPASAVGPSIVKIKPTPTGHACNAVCESRKR